tara:strand:- start:82 stop:213 length:132 start_codon:yes stop_codon:yes gene_type:complete
MAFARSVEMNDFAAALGLSFLFLILFVGGFWLGVHWQIQRGKR